MGTGSQDSVKIWRGINIDICNTFQISVYLYTDNNDTVVFNAFCSRACVHDYMPTQYPDYALPAVLTRNSLQRILD